MITDQRLRDEVLHLLAITNNFLMDLEVKGDNVLKSADIMQRCHALYNYIKPVQELEDVSKEINREAFAGTGDSAGSND